MKSVKRNEMTGRRNSILNRHGAASLLAFVLCCLMLLGIAAPAGAEPTGECTVNVVVKGMPDYDSDVDIIIGLYKVGILKTDGTFEMDAKYATMDVVGAKTSEELDAALKALNTSVNGAEHISKKLENGKLSFTGLEPGVYFGRLESGPVEFGMEPFAVKLLTIVEVNPKWSLVTNAEVEKIWDDAGKYGEDQDGLRPASVVVGLYANDEPCRIGGEEYKTTLNEENGWKAEVTSLPKYDKDGALIRYHWVELVIPDNYDCSYDYGSETDEEKKGIDAIWTTAVTNKHDPALISLKIQKIWDDNDDQDGKRPESLTVKLTAKVGEAEAETIATLTLDEENKWTAKVSDVPVYGDHGKEVVYTWVEDVSDTEYNQTSYTSSADPDEEDTVLTTITNTHEPGKVSASVRKVWNDNGDQDNLRPASVTIELLCNGAKTGKSVVLPVVDEKGEEAWIDTITDLDEYTAGKLNEYTWNEIKVDGYESVIGKAEGTITTITNTHTPETVDLTIIKIWDDDDNRDGIRPASITVELSTGVRYVLNEENSWSVTVTGLPKYEHGKEAPINYVWKEIDGELDGRYVQSKPVREEGSYITSITNTHAPELVSVSVDKIWNDADNQDGVRPASISVQLLANGVKQGEPVELNAANNWHYEWKDLYRYEKKSVIVYSVAEVNAPEGYVVTYGSTDRYALTITNTYEPEKTSYRVSKIWEDGSDKDGIRPASISVQLLANGTVADTVTLTAAGDWTHTWTGLDRYENGKEIVYSVAEVEVADYTVAYDTTTAGTTIITNTHESDNTYIHVKKIWDDDDNKNGKRPDSVTVTLYANGTAIRTAKLTAPTWKVVWEDLDKSVDGKDIVYTVDETPVPANYKSAVKSTSENGFVVTNTYTPNGTPKTGVEDYWPYLLGGACLLLLAAAFMVVYLRRTREGK